MNKGRRNELRDLKWKRRLKNLGLKRIKQRDFICYRDQGKPCSCAICSPQKAKGDKEKYKQVLGELYKRFYTIGPSYLNNADFKMGYDELQRQCLRYLT